MTESAEKPTLDLEQILKTLLEKMGLDVTVSARTEEDTLHLTVSGPDADLARGKKGEVLDALQYLLGRVLGNAGTTGQRVLLDIGSFRASREKSIADVARFLAQKAVTLKKPVAVYPMGSHDRRVIHTILAEGGEAYSQSEGEGLARRLFVIPGSAPERRESREPRRSEAPSGRPSRREGGERRERGERRRQTRGGRRHSEVDNGPPLGTPENPYIMEPPPEPPDD